MPAPRMLTPIADVAAFIQRRRDIADFVQNVLVAGADYGSASGSDEQKPTLLKPGAEKFVAFFGLEPHLTLLEQRIELDRPEPFIFFSYHCAMVRDGILYGEADGCASSHEIKYRYRWVPAELVPPHLDISSLPKRDNSITEFDFAIQKAETTGPYGKPAEYWERWKEAIKSGKAIRTQKISRTGKTMDAWVMPNVLYRVPNPDVADQINTIMKMAQKRAFVAATLIACGISELFTQDIEDWATQETNSAEMSHNDEHKTPSNAKPSPLPPATETGTAIKAEPEEEYTIPLRKQDQAQAGGQPETPARIEFQHLPVESLSAAKRRVLNAINNPPNSQIAINEYLRAACKITSKTMPKMHPLYHDAIWRLALGLEENPELAESFMTSPDSIADKLPEVTGSSFSVDRWITILSERYALPKERILSMTDKLSGMTNQEMLHWFILAYHDIASAQTMLDKNINPTAAHAAVSANLRRNVTLTSHTSAEVASAIDKFLRTME